MQIYELAGNGQSIYHRNVEKRDLHRKNMVIHSDFMVNGVLKVEKYDDCFVLTNPGLLKLPIEQIYKGGESKARNQRMQNMFRMIGYG